MAEAADRSAWLRTFALMATLHNKLRGEHDQAIDPMQFYPWGDRRSEAQPAPPTETERRWLKKTFPGARG